MKCFRQRFCTAPYGCTGWRRRRRQTPRFALPGRWPEWQARWPQGSQLDGQGLRMEDILPDRVARVQRCLCAMGGRPSDGIVAVSNIHVKRVVGLFIGNRCVRLTHDLSDVRRFDWTRVSRTETAGGCAARNTVHFQLATASLAASLPRGSPARRPPATRAIHLGRTISSMLRLRTAIPRGLQSGLSPSAYCEMLLSIPNVSTISPVAAAPDGSSNSFV